MDTVSDMALAPPAGSWSRGAWGLRAGLAVRPADPSGRHHLNFLLRRMWVVGRLGEVFDRSPAPAAECKVAVSCPQVRGP